MVAGDSLVSVSIDVLVSSRDRASTRVLYFLSQVPITLPLTLTGRRFCNLGLRVAKREKTGFHTLRRKSTTLGIGFTLGTEG